MSNAEMHRDVTFSTREFETHLPAAPDRVPSMKGIHRNIVIATCLVVAVISIVSLVRNWPGGSSSRLLGATAPVTIRCAACLKQYALESREYRHRGALIYHPRYAKGEEPPRCPLCKAVYASMLPATCPSCGKLFIIADAVAAPAARAPEEIRKLCPFEHP